MPRQVWEEVVTVGAGLPGSAELAQATWARIVDGPDATDLSAVLSAELDRGEAAAIAVALSARADRLLVDDRAGRRVAQRLGIPAIGTLGILVAARRRSEEGPLAPLLVALREGGFWMSAALEAGVLAEVGEVSGG